MGRVLDVNQIRDCHHLLLQDLAHPDTQFICQLPSSIPLPRALIGRIIYYPLGASQDSILNPFLDGARSATVPSSLPLLRLQSLELVPAEGDSADPTRE